MRKKHQDNWMKQFSQMKENHHAFDVTHESPTQESSEELAKLQEAAAVSSSERLEAWVQRALYRNGGELRYLGDNEKHWLAFYRNFKQAKLA